MQPTLGIWKVFAHIGSEQYGTIFIGKIGVITTLFLNHAQVMTFLKVYLITFHLKCVVFCCLFLLITSAILGYQDWAKYQK